MALRGEIERVRGLQDPRNEAEAKQWVITPVLHALGWDPLEPSKMTPEYSVGKDGGRVDFALLGRAGKPVAVIEAKVPGVRLEDHVAQVVGYAFHTGVDICVLTTGFLWWLYLPRERGSPAERRFAALDIKTGPLDPLIASFEAYLAYDALVSGRAEQNAKQALNETILLQIWNDMLREPPQELIDLVEGRVLRATGHSPDKDRVVRFLGKRNDPGPPVPPKKLKGGSPGPPGPSKEPKRNSSVLPPPSTKPVAYVLFGQRHAVKSWRDIWIGVAERLYERHGDRGFGNIVGKPRGQRSYVEYDNVEMASPRRIGNSRYQIETHGSSDALKKRWAVLLTLLGHSRDDLRLVFD